MYFIGQNLIGCAWKPIFHAWLPLLCNRVKLLNMKIYFQVVTFLGIKIFFSPNTLDCG